MNKTPELAKCQQRHSLIKLEAHENREQPMLAPGVFHIFKLRRLLQLVSYLVALDP